MHIDTLLDELIISENKKCKDENGYDIFYSELDEKLRWPMRTTKKRQIGKLISALFPNFSVSAQDRNLDAPPNETLYERLYDQRNKSVEAKSYAFVMYWYITNKIVKNKAKSLEEIKFMGMYNEAVDRLRRRQMNVEKYLSNFDDDMRNIYGKFNKHATNKNLVEGMLSHFNSDNTMSTCNVPDGVEISKADIEKFKEVDCDFACFEESYHKAMSHYDRLFAHFTGLLIKNQAKNKKILDTLTKQEEKMLRLLHEINREYNDSSDFYKRLSNGEWEIIPIGKRQELFFIIKKLSCDEVIINKYACAESEQTLIESLRMARMKLLCPQLYRIQLKVYDITDNINDYDVEINEENSKIIVQLDNVVSEALTLAQKIGGRTMDYSCLDTQDDQ